MFQRNYEKEVVTHPAFIEKYTVFQSRLPTQIRNNYNFLQIQPVYIRGR